MEKKYEVLFEPVKVGSLIVPNRFVVAPMSSRTASEDNVYYDYGKTYFAERVKGGFGITITEFIAVSPNGLGNVIEPGIWSDRFIPSLKELTDECHKYPGGYIFAQLHHAGAKAVSVNGSPVYGPSDRFDDKGNQTAVALSNTQVYEVINMFIDGAERAKKAGFDGVEIHGAHMYLLYQFMSNGFNKRSDEFGGSYENRFRIIDLIIKGIKKRCGKDYPVGFRINSSNMEAEGNTIEDYCVFVKLAEASGADYIHMSHPYVLMSYYTEPAYNRKNSRILKDAVNIPVILVGRINDENLAADIISSGDADMIALGRQSVADPHFPNKIKNDEKELIYHCMACGQRCHNSSKGCEDCDTGISCMINPFSGKENRWHISPVKKKKKVAVIGAGVAGMQAAWILAARGDEVTVYEKTNKVGGLFELASKTPGKDVLGRAVQTIYNHCIRYGVSFVFNTTISSDDIKELDVDQIVVACGARPKLPDITGLKENTLFAQELISGEKKCGERVAILGGASVALETAELLVKAGKQVDIIYRGPQENLGRNMIRIIKGQLLNELKDKVTYHLNCEPMKINDDGTVLVRNVGNDILLGPYDTIVSALGYESYNPFADFKNEQLSVVGDAKEARDAKYAIYEASRLALELE